MSRTIVVNRSWKWYHRFRAEFPAVFATSWTKSFKRKGRTYAGLRSVVKRRTSKRPESSRPVCQPRLSSSTWRKWKRPQDLKWFSVEKLFRGVSLSKNYFADHRVDKSKNYFAEKQKVTPSLEVKRGPELYGCMNFKIVMLVNRLWSSKERLTGS